MGEGVTTVELREIALQMKALAEKVLADTEPTREANEPEPRWETVAAFAKRTGYSERKIRDYARRGMSHVGKGRSLRIIVADALDWIERGGPTAAAAISGQQAARKNNANKTR